MAKLSPDSSMCKVLCIWSDLPGCVCLCREALGLQWCHLFQLLTVVFQTTWIVWRTGWLMQS